MDSYYSWNDDHVRPCKKVCWADAKRVFQSASGDGAAFNSRCAAEPARELKENDLHMKNAVAEGQRSVDVQSWTAS